MLKNDILILKNVTKLQLLKLQYNVKVIIITKKNLVYKLERLLVYYDIKKKKMCKKLYYGVNIIFLQTYYKCLSVLENKIILLKKKILNIENNLKREQLLLKNFYKKMKTWNLLYDNIVCSELLKKNQAIEKYWNQYYQIFLLKKRSS